MLSLQHRAARAQKLNRSDHGHFRQVSSTATPSSTRCTSPMTSPSPKLRPDSLQDARMRMATYFQDSWIQQMRNLRQQRTTTMHGRMMSRSVPMNAKTAEVTSNTDHRRSNAWGSGEAAKRHAAVQQVRRSGRLSAQHRAWRDHREDWRS